MTTQAPSLHLNELLAKEQKESAYVRRYLCAAAQQGELCIDEVVQLIGLRVDEDKKTDPYNRYFDDGPVAVPQSPNSYLELSTEEFEAIDLIRG